MSIVTINVPDEVIYNLYNSEKEFVDVSAAEGRICASPAVTCPPAVPPVISGEVITKTAIDCMLHYGIDKIEVVK